MRLELPEETKQTKLANIKERIEKARNNSLGGVYLNIMAAAVISAGIVLSSYTGFSYLVFCAFTGAVFAAIGLYSVAKCGKEYSSLIKEIEEMTIQTPKCNDCGKELPQGDFEFCPYCGKSLIIETLANQALVVSENLESSLLS